MAFRARLIASKLLEPLARRRVRVDRGQSRDDAIGRGCQRLAEKGLRDEDAAASRRGVIGLRVPREHTRLPQDAGAAGLRTQRQLHETRDRKSTRLNSSHGYISYAVF